MSTKRKTTATKTTDDCKNCAKVLEEMKNMREDFKKLINHLSKQITDLSYEIKNLSNNEKCNCSLRNNNQKKSTTFAHTPNKNKNASSIKSFKLESDNLNDDDDGNVDNDEFFASFMKDIDDGEGDGDNFELAIKSNENLKYKPTINSEMPTFKSPEKTPNYSFDDFYHIKTRVMPKNPFKSIEEVKDWDHLLKYDDDQVEQLRKELKDHPYEAPGKYVRKVLHQLLHKDLATQMTYRGNFKTNKYGMKELYFTTVFKDIFLERYKQEDDYSYAHQVKGFFHYVNDRSRQKRGEIGKNNVTTVKKQETELPADKFCKTIASSIVKMELEQEKGEFESVEIGIDEHITTEIELLKEDVDIFEAI